MSEREWIYENDFGNAVRYTLGVKGNNPLFCIGINPSTAVPGDLDNTLKSVERLSSSNGFDGWIMLNVYAQRATNPNDLHKERDRSLHLRNMCAIATLLSAYESPVLWAAWGTLILKRSYLKDCLTHIVKWSKHDRCRWVTIGPESKDGHPHHPLYLRKTEKYREFQIDRYIENLNARRNR